MRNENISRANSSERAGINNNSQKEKKRYRTMSEVDVIYANFQPSDARLLKSRSNNQLLIENPILASVLSKLFPYLLLMDNFLEIITWTNGNPYTNLLIMIGYSIIVMYWQALRLVILPLLISLLFSYIIWSVNSILFDTRNNEKPTIDEILFTLHNITIRFELLLRPIKQHNLKPKNFLQIFVVSVLLTPVQLLLVKFFISPQKFLWLSGLFLLSYHSPWSYTIRRLLWRSIYVRILIFYLTGLNIKLNFENEMKPLNSFTNTLSDFKIVLKTIESPTKLNQIIKFEVLENERRWLGFGWSKFLLPNERSNFCFENSLIEVPNLHDFKPPVFDNDLYEYNWEWLEDDWSIDKEYSKNKNDGWKYFDSNWENGDYFDGFSKFTRCRKWTRRAKLIIDKKSKVYDE